MMLDLPGPHEHSFGSALESEEWVRCSLCVVQARINARGELLQANAGFQHLLIGGAPQAPACARQVRAIFQSPTLDELLELPMDATGQVYAGLLTLGWPTVSRHSLNGWVRREGDALLLMAEHNVNDWDHLQCKVLALNENLIDSQRALARANRNLTTRVMELDAALTLSRTQAQELRIAAIAFETQESVFIADGQLKLLRVNPAFSRHTGVDAVAAIGMAWTDILAPRHGADFLANVWQLLTRKGTWEGECWTRRAGGSDSPSWLTLTAVHDEVGTCSHYVGCFLDISARKAAEDEIYHLAFHDALTQLPNRRLLHERLRHALAIHQRRGAPCALIFLDLDNFKAINDSLGHDFGDALLVAVGRRISACVRECDTVARLGGDEFVILLEGLDAEMVGMQAERVAQKVAEQVRQRHSLTLDRDGAVMHVEHFCTASIGIAVQQGPDQSADELLRHADLAMYQAKASGRNLIRSFESHMQARMLERTALESDLRETLHGGQRQLQLYFQVQIDADNNPMGAEALLRWCHPTLGMISPAQFIPLAEESDLILTLGLWVLNKACEQLAAWAAHPVRASLTLSVNVSPKQFLQTDFVDSVFGILTEHHAPPTRLKLELTESTLISKTDEVMSKLHQLRKIGVGLSLDDFGTGFSSLAYLKLLPLDQIKIDQGFVAGLPDDAHDAAICRTIIDLAKNLDIAVIAEGVESQAQLEFLRANCCQHYQGYLFGKPVPIEDLEPWLDSHSPSLQSNQTRSLC
ncbi:EAL domain-containing protein [Paucibacter sp. B2R-40]|uniref:putative bifunctional diguanylate cyclase/phosphodiesterase n=1 Tax=Paucibacter sp. B2R-40 TaxID=2893554 RepID=UPI0021E37265|nr:EAL domain-containing protein [Paucibacter sp. B2R-40]MCV2356308.1 EAL domain-containing protein [Paucibacter sp. B2R-40]